VICRERFPCWSILSVATRGVSYLWRGLVNTSWVCLYNRPPVFFLLVTGEEPQLAPLIQCRGARKTTEECASQPRADTPSHLPRAARIALRPNSRFDTRSAPPVGENAMENDALDERSLRNASASAPLTFDESKRRMEEAARWIAGGINSNFRAGISPTPLVVERGQGPYLFDADGNRLIDYYLGMGPMILGHSPKAVKQAVAEQLERGLLFAAQSSVEVEAARRVCAIVPCAERLRFASSGSEAVQAAIRLARAATGRTIIVKFEGHYHGWLDNILWSVAPASDVPGAREAPTALPASQG